MSCTASRKDPWGKGWRHGPSAEPVAWAATMREIEDAPFRHPGAGLLGGREWPGGWSSRPARLSWATGGMQRPDKGVLAGVHRRIAQDPAVGGGSGSAAGGTASGGMSSGEAAVVEQYLSTLSTQPTQNERWLAEWGIPESTSDWATTCEPRSWPCDIPRLDVRDNTTICRGLVETNVTIHSDCVDNGMEGLVSKAWCLLADNLDLVHWVACMVFGTDGNSLEGRIRGMGYNVEIRCNTRTTGLSAPCSTDGGSRAASFPDLFGGFIHLCADHASIVEYVRVWSAGNAVERLCVAIEMASLLLHELTHAAGVNVGDGDMAAPCRRSYLAGSTMKYLLLKRYPRALDAECCSDWVTLNGGPDPGQLFFNDQSIVMDLDGSCAPLTAADAGGTTVDPWSPPRIGGGGGGLVPADPGQGPRNPWGGGDPSDG